MILVFEAKNGVISAILEGHADIMYTFICVKNLKFFYFLKA